jgi:hypothetical protein
MTIKLVLGSTLLVTGCVGGSSDDGDGAGGPASQQFVPGTAKQDGDSVQSDDPRLVGCELEYESFTPFDTVQAAPLDATFGSIVTNGAFAGDDRYRLEIYSSSSPPFNLSFIAQLTELSSGKTVAYTVLPAPEVGGAYLFELGGAITPIALEGRSGTHNFDFLRSYCWIRNP